MSLLLLKYSQRTDFAARLRDILSLLWQLSEQETALEYLETALRYITGSSDKVSLEELGQIVQEVLQEGADVMPTIAEQLLRQGREEGREEGLEQGLQRGRAAAQVLLQRYLATRFEVPLDQFDAALADCDLETLTQLSQIAFEASTLAEFEAGLAKVTADKRPEQNGDTTND
jgi:hypothetical protein